MKPNYKFHTGKLERIAGAIQITSRELPKKELGLESLSDRRWVRKLSFLYKIVKENSPQYLSCYLNGNNSCIYNTKSVNQITLNTFRRRAEKFRNSFFLFSVSEWNKLSNLSRQSENIQKIKNTLMKDVKSNEQLLFSVHDIQGVKLFS